ncbi:hypothetical protein ADL15_42135 [Actinoplanes awajinensis subsp. mycoplanecinus]|uniref:Uncharacterized protein n=2 Tax=Actinoplanes awajinensis TaxID=135946 RepID=A0A101JDS2_9ACTN|nr:hypothetical protein ADL15_42135 [Actinoplanes awajinensis subsp. mycoplanecinus]
MGPHRLRAVLVRFGGGSLRLQIMTGVALAATAVLVLAVAWAGHSGGPAGEDPGDVVRVGVVEGQSVAGYLDSAQRELSMLADPSGPAAGDTWALISLRDYAAPDRLPALLDGALVAQVYARVPLPDTRTQVSLIPVYRWPGDVTAGMLDAALVRDQEQADYLRLERSLTGDDQRQTRLRATYANAARTAAQEAAAYRSGCSCVFAAVVRATPATLDDIASRAAVRAVDPAPEVRTLDRTEFRPPLPEERGTVSAEPSAVPVPTVAPDVASTSPARLPSSIGITVTSASPDRRVAGSPAVVTSSPEPLAVPSEAEVSAAHEGSSASAEASGAEPER